MGNQEGGENSNQVKSFSQEDFDENSFRRKKARKNMFYSRDGMLSIPAKMVLLGASMVGKTSMQLRLTDGRFNENIESTIAASFISKTIDNFVKNNTKVKFEIYDIAGQERFEHLIENFYKDGTSVAMVVYDIADEKSFQRAKDIMELIIGIDNNSSSSSGGGRKKKILYFVGNKIDLENRRKVKKEKVGEYLEFIQKLKTEKITWMECSAKTGENIDKIFCDASSRILNDYFDTNEENQKSEKEIERDKKIEEIEKYYNVSKRVAMNLDIEDIKDYDSKRPKSQKEIKLEKEIKDVVLDESNPFFCSIRSKKNHRFFPATVKLTKLKIIIYKYNQKKRSSITLSSIYKIEKSWKYKRIMVFFNEILGKKNHLFLFDGEREFNRFMRELSLTKVGELMKNEKKEEIFKLDETYNRLSKYFKLKPEKRISKSFELHSIDLRNLNLEKKYKNLFCTFQWSVLKKIDLRKTEIVDEGLIYFCEKAPKTLEVLILMMNNNITEVGVAALGSLFSRNIPLRILDLKKTGIGDMGARKLMKDLVSRDRKEFFFRKSRFIV